MIFLDSLEAMLSISLLCGIGFMIAYMGWVSAETEIFLPKLITKVVMPPYLMSNILQNFDRNQFLHIIVSSFVPILSMIICFVVFRLLATVIRIDKRRRGTAALVGTVSNTILIGIPVNIALFGEGSLPFVLLYFFANTLFFWSVGAYILSSEGTKDVRHSVKDKLKQIFSPPLCGVICGIVLVMLNVSLPKVVMDTCRYLGQLTTPLALIFVGITLARVDFKRAHLGRDILAAIAGRLVLSPCIFLLILFFLPLPRLMAQVFLIQSALPCMAMMSVVAAYYGADKEYATTLVALTTVLGMITVPVWMTLISYLQL